MTTAMSVSIFADALQHLDAVELRHHQVEDDEVVAAGPDLVLDLRRIAQRLDLVAVALEQRLHVVADGSVVVDDQDPNGGKLDGHGILLSQGRKGLAGIGPSQTTARL